MQTSIIKYSELTKASHSYRWDAEFFDPRVLANEALIQQRNSCLFDELIEEITGGATPLGAEYPIQGIPFLRVQNIMQNYIDLSDIVFIKEDDHRALLRSQLQKNDVLLTITGVSYGKSAVIMNENIGNNINQHSVRMKIKKVNPFYLSTFLNCKYGYMQSTKHVVGITRPALDYQSIKRFSIPLFSEKFQQSIEDMVLKAHAEREKANILTKEASEMLEKELGIYEWTPPKKALNIAIKKYSETKTANRIDAEYYQEKYEAILAKIKSYRGGYKTLGEVSHTIEKGLEPGSKYYTEDGIPFIRIANLTPYELSLSNAVCLSNEYYKKNKKYQPKQGDILLSKDGTAGIAYYLYDEPKHMIPCGGILRLDTDLSIIKAEVLALILNSTVVKNQVEQTIGGAIILHWRTEDIYNTIIPIIDKNIQDIIAEKITIAHQSRQEAKRLLELAKFTVENAIENGE